MENGVKLTNGYHNNHSDISISKNGDLKVKAKDMSNHSTHNGTDETFLNGPNQLLPSTEYTTTLPSGRVKLRVLDKGVASEPPVSVPGLLSRTVARYPDVVAIASRNPDGSWDKSTYREYQQLIRTCAKGFIELGLQKHHAVCILGFNSPQWFISDLAAIHAGGIAAGIYTTNSSEACYHVLDNSQANVVVVQDSNQMEKIRSIWPRLPNLKAAIQWEGEIDPPLENTYTWNQMMKLGAAQPDTKLDEILKSMGINECCTLVYTSGTVGNPKGVMLSHDNLVWEVHALTLQLDNWDPGYESIVSYLPLSHVAAQVVDIYLPLYNAVSIYFADKDALKGSLIKTLQDVQPTRFLGVPRVWEKMYEKMMSISASNGPLKRAIAGWAKQQSLNHHIDRINGIDYVSYSFSLAKFLVLKRVKAALGFSRCRLFVTAAAPLSADIKKYFLSLDIPLMDVFGMSEVSGAHTLSTIKAFNLDSVGKILNGVETKIDNPELNNGHGEICLRGRHVFMGYLGEVKKTEEAIDEEGWLHSGDVGTTDVNGFLSITGRIKELLITAGGENVAPVAIEQQLKSELPFISNAMVVGDRKKYLSVLLSFQTEIDPETGAPIDKLNSESLRWLASLGSSATTVTEILSQNEETVMKAINDGIVKANRAAISNAQKVQKFKILPVDFSINTGELGPTMKIKRNVVAAKYEDIIESMYKV
ncbi:very long-chain-fatty-acid--CoA ligase bubblegum-like isoform X2 [Arctopsyche grandis]|uniref:very long-chain-fatty-acid--CoA ligase bubblegum-like isoform X2 n=1 Tax=Arctopsyche grandis TaxID=121162 RepID=UPI00406D9799